MPPLARRFSDGNWTLVPIAIRQSRIPDGNWTLVPIAIRPSRIPDGNWTLVPIAFRTLHECIWAPALMRIL